MLRNEGKLPDTAMAWARTREWAGAKTQWAGHSGEWPGAKHTAMAWAEKDRMGWGKRKDGNYEEQRIQKHAGKMHDPDGPAAVRGRRGRGGRRKSQ